MSETGGSSGPRRRTARNDKSNSNKFAFVAVDAEGKPPASSRDFIRSHVMRGKNMRKAAGQTRPLSWINSQLDAYHGDESDQQKHRSAEKLAYRLPQDYMNISQGYDVDGKPVVVISAPTLPGPFRTPHDFALHRLSVETDYATRGLLYRFFTTIKTSLYPVEWCFQDDPAKICWFQWLYDNAAYFYSILFSVSCIQDAISGATNCPSMSIDANSVLSPLTQNYLRKTIGILQQQIQDRKQQLADSTAAVVITLAMIADAMGDNEACKAHVEGLKEIVRVRGGMKSFEHNSQLQIKICRMDLGWSIKTGTKPTFFKSDISWNSFFDKVDPKQDRITPESADCPIQSWIKPLDLRLYHVFSDMRTFSKTVNAVVGPKYKLKAELFQEIMISMQYRLLLLEYSLEGQLIEEAVRVGLLAFKTTIFLRVEGIQNTFEFMAGRLHEIILELDASVDILADLKLWLIVMGSMSVFNRGDPWLLDTFRELTPTVDYQEFRTKMKGILWINVAHDGPSLRLFKMAHSQ